MVEQDQAQDRRIVVGVDNSAGSVEALRWAPAHARQTGGSVEARHRVAASARVRRRLRMEADRIDGADLARYAEKALTDTVAQARGGEDNPVAVTTRAVEGPAAQVLLAAGKGVELLVLGSRGHGAFAGMLLGSVSQRCVQHAACPTVVIPE